MHDRIKLLRKHLGLNQTDFGAKIGVKQGSVAGYETGARIPLDAVIASICREFRVNEEWLRTGAGEMFIQVTRSQQIADFMADVLSEAPDGPRNVVVSALSQLDADDWQAIAEILRKFRTNP